MFVQTEVTPNPNSLKFLPGKAVSKNGSFEVTKKEEIDNELVRNLLSINGVEGVFLGADFLSINKKEDIIWEDIKHIVISLINEMTICLTSSQTTSSFLLIDKKSAPRNTPVTPWIDKRFLTNSLSVSSFFVTSKEPLLDTFFPGKNLSELGLGVTSV